MNISIVDAWRTREAREFFRNVWPMYVHELSGFDSNFYVLDEAGRWQPDIVDDWVSGVTPPGNLRAPRSEQDPMQPFQRTHVIAKDTRPVGFVCVGLRPFRYMPDDVDFSIAEFFLIHGSRGTGAGRQALHLLLDLYPGRWHLSAIHDNARAIRFWTRTLPLLGVRELETRHESGDVTWQFVV